MTEQKMEKLRRLIDSSLKAVADYNRIYLKTSTPGLLNTETKLKKALKLLPQPLV